MAKAGNVLTFDRIALGGVYADHAVEWTNAQAARYTRAVRSAAGLSAASDGAVAFLLPASWSIPRVAFEQWQVPGGGIHAQQSWRAGAALPPVGALRLRTIAVEKYRKNGRPYVVFESTLTDDSGTVFGEGRMTLAWPE